MFTICSCVNLSFWIWSVKNLRILIRDFVLSAPVLKAATNHSPAATCHGWATGAETAHRYASAVTRLGAWGSSVFMIRSPDEA